MKKFFFGAFLLLAISAFTQEEESYYRYILNNSFTTGEVLTYRVHYGMVNAAEAVMEISDEIHNVNGRSCYKIDISGNTTGLFDLVFRIRDTWGAYLDTAAFVPHKSYRYIEEGRYRKYEIVNFNHSEDRASVINLDKNTKKPKKKGEFPIPEDVLDIVGGYYFLRTLDFSNIKVGETIEMQGFFVDEVYKIEVKFLGREKLNTKVGEINTLVIAPILPDNKFFSGDDPVRAWISDDLNKVPLKIKANLSVGALEIDIKSMKNLRN